MSSSKAGARRIGILAYGSLLEEPGSEIASLIADKIPGTITPFPIEFFRSSSTRGGAPTVVPVENAGAFVLGTVLVLREGISPKEARDLLWRRESRREGTGQRYSKPAGSDPDQMTAEELVNFAGVDLVFYARFGATLSDPTPEELAELAIRSVATEAGRKGLDGISYLISIKRQGIVTPLMPAYERAILAAVGVRDLESAVTIVRSRDPASRRA